MIESIRFGTFNVGSGSADNVALMKEIKKPDSDLANKLKKASNITDYENIENEAQAAQEIIVADKVASLFDVICLQEVRDLNRPFMQELTEQGFTFTQATADTVIATRIPTIIDIGIKSKTNEDDSRPYGDDIAAINLTINRVNVAVASMHSHGFQLYTKPKKDKEPEDVSYVRNDHEMMRRSAIYTEETVRVLKESNADVLLVGGDLNNNPRNYGKPFQILNEIGLKTLKPNQKTNINEFDNNYRLRTIDFLFAGARKGSQTKVLIAPSRLTHLFHNFTSLFVDRVFVTVTPATVPEGFEYELGKNCSDHKPVITTITVERRYSLYHRFISRPKE